MKIISCDNFGQDRSEILIAENVSVFNAKRIVEFLNAREGEKSPDFYLAVKDDYKLYKMDPNAKNSL